MTRGDDRARVLVLFWSEDASALRVAIRHHLKVLEYADGVDVLYHNARHGAPAWLARSAPDAVVLHTTFLCMRWSHLFSGWKWGLRWLRELDALKIAMPQDEYDHSEILDEWLYELGVDVIFSNFGAEKRRLLYPLMQSRARFLRAFTGYIDDATANRLAARLRPAARRPHDVVYRATRLPYWFGSHGQLKFRIGEEAWRRSSDLALSVDISSRIEDTIVGEAWLEFLASGRAVVGCESGSSVLDRRGEIRAAIRRILQEQPRASFDDVSARLPIGWDSFDFFAVSPRHFEAVITKTAQILVDGRYDGIFEAGRHYIPVKRDLSDLDDALAKAADHRLVDELADRAYEEIYLSGNYSYRRLADELHALVAAMPRRRRRVAARALWAAAPVGLRATPGGLPELPPAMTAIAFRPRHTLAAALVVARVAVGDGAVRQLLARLLGAKRTPLTAIASDLLRLAAVAAVRRHAVAPGSWFNLAVELEDEGRTVVLRSTDARDGEAMQQAEERTAVDAVRRGSVLSICWDHRAIGQPVPIPVLPSRAPALDVHVGDRYDFTTISGAATAWPLETSTALLSLLDADAASKSRVARAVTHPRFYVSLFALTGRELLWGRGLRWVAAAYARDRRARREVSAEELARDMLRASILLDAARSKSLRLDVVVEDGALVVRSLLGSSAPERWKGDVDVPVARLIWDHSRVGDAVDAPGSGKERPSISLGHGGIYEFGALSRLARTEHGAGGVAFLDALKAALEER